MPIIMMVCFARSGGTILNQCLGSLPKTVFMSEVSPLAGNWRKNKTCVGTIKEQAKYWYDIDLKSNGFVESALELAEICKRDGRMLVIRDWTFGGYLPTKNNLGPTPDRILSLEALENRCEVLPFCFVRDPIDVWLSLTKRMAIEIKTFFKQYLKYIQAIKVRNISVFKYEDFVRHPQENIRQICEHTGLEFSDSWKNYMSYDKVIGDTQFDPLSRGRKVGIIRSIPRRRLPEKKITEINQCKEMIIANNLLDYPTSYYDVQRESMFSAISERCMRLIHRYPRGLIRKFQR